LYIIDQLILEIFGLFTLLTLLLVRGALLFCDKFIFY